MCPSNLPGGGQAGVRVGGGPSGVVYGLQVPPQALVPAPRVGLSHAGGGGVRAGRLPLLGGACRHRSAPGAAVASHQKEGEKLVEKTSIRLIWISLQ